VPLSELKRAEVSISGLRREGRALYLSQRSGPTLALWPVEGGHARSAADPSLAEEVEDLRREVNELRREVEQAEAAEAGVGRLRHADGQDVRHRSGGDRAGCRARGGHLARRPVHGVRHILKPAAFEE
jgi:hypothetical protein